MVEMLDYLYTLGPLSLPAITLCAMVAMLLVGGVWWLCESHGEKQ